MKFAITAIGVILIAGLVILYYFANQLDGSYVYKTENKIQATLTIRGDLYELCFQGCKSGNLKVWGPDSGDEYVHFYGPMSEFGKVVDAPFDPDKNGQYTVVRLNHYTGITGTRLAVEDPGTGKFDYFEKEARFSPSE